MRKTYKYKIKPMRAGVRERAVEQLNLACDLYNTCLEQRITYWKYHQKNQTANNQKKKLTELKKAMGYEGYKRMGSQVSQDVIERLDRAYDNFFRRVKQGETPGFPRFKPKKRYQSITFKQTGWKFTGKNSIYLQGIGVLKYFNSREFPEGSHIKTATLKKGSADDWFIYFSLDNVEPVREKKTKKTIALDLGLLKYYTDDQGSSIPNPRHLQKSEKNLKLAQQKLARKQRGGKNREKQRVQVARLHQKVKDSRLDYQFKLIKNLVRDYDLIIIEELKIRRMIEDGHLAKSIHDAAWGQFIRILIFKAEEAGKEVRMINPRNTSQECSNCGELPEVRKSLKDRKHDCVCGASLDRDHNAARNIRRRGEPGSKSSKSFDGRETPIGRARSVETNPMIQESPVF